jgi:hypothetical protein
MNTIIASPTSNEHNFDFLIGRWRVYNRKLQQRLQQCSTWDEFEAMLDVRKILQGWGNVDSFVANVKGRDIEGMTLRLFNPTTRLWSLYWVDSVRKVLDPPLVGSFESGVGKFYCDDVFEGKPIVICFTWSEITEQSATWEQAFSADNAASWETNWTMKFTRA